MIWGRYLCSGGLMAHGDLQCTNEHIIKIFTSLEQYY